MAALSSSVEEKSRKMIALIFSRFSDAKQSAIAATIGVSDGTVSKYKSEHMDMCCKLLAAAGLKVVPEEVKCYPREELDALFVIARANMSRAENVDQLLWGGQ